MEHSPAFDRAAALAKAEGAALHILAFDYLEGLATAGLVNEQALEQMRIGYVERHHQWLEDQARPLRNLGLTVTTEVAWVERPLQEILIRLKEEPMAVVIKALEHESLLSRLMFTPLDVHLIRECPVPLHFVSGAPMRYRARSWRPSTRSITTSTTTALTTASCMKPSNWRQPAMPRSR